MTIHSRALHTTTFVPASPALVPDRPPEPAPAAPASEARAPEGLVPERRAPVHNAYAVEVDDTTVGIVIRETENDFTFIAATRAFYPMDQRRFASPAAAQRAALALAGDRRGTLRTFAAR
jgi:hypothetical protein